MRASRYFSAVDSHTEGMPTRVITGGLGTLPGASMQERRLHFERHLDDLRLMLMREPRGHSAMSGAFLQPPTRPDANWGVLYIEVSGCLPMCGHGTIGSVTFALEHGLVTPLEEGVVALDAPAGKVTARYRRDGAHVESVRLFNVPSYLAMEGVPVVVEGIGELVVDIAYGGNFYAIVDKQKNFPGLEDVSVDWLLRSSPVLRRRVNEAVSVVHPDDPTIRDVSHVQWTGAPRDPKAHGRNAVFYGERAIDRSPCGTGTSARIAQLAARGWLKPGDDFVHESIIGTLFEGRVEAVAQVGNHAAIVPSVAGWARTTGLNTIFVDPRDPLAGGFSLT